MEGFSITPFLVAGVLAFLAAIGWRAPSLGRVERAAYLIVLAVLSGWVIASASMAIGGVYSGERFWAMSPMIWLPFAPALFCMAAVALPPFRRALIGIADDTPMHWFVWFQAIRIAAIGTAIKAYQGEFPLVLELAIGVPDLLFGLSALWVAARVKRGAFSADALALWNLVGAAIILVPGIPLIELSAPGPNQLLFLEPNASVMLEFPLALAPTFTVPILVSLNLWIALHLMTRRSPEAAA